MKTTDNTLREQRIMAAMKALDILAKTLDILAKEWDDEECPQEAPATPVRETAPAAADPQESPAAATPQDSTVADAKPDRQPFDPSVTITPPGRYNTDTSHFNEMLLHSCHPLYDYVDHPPKQNALRSASYDTERKTYCGIPPIAAPPNFLRPFGSKPAELERQSVRAEPKDRL